MPQVALRLQHLAIIEVLNYAVLRLIGLIQFMKVNVELIQHLFIWDKLYLSHK